jgi:hypothetical protein
MGADMKILDYIGFKYDGYEVVDFTGDYTFYGTKIWLVKCPCGKLHRRTTSNLSKRSPIKKCDCWHPHNYKNGDAKDLSLRREYGITKKEYKEMLDSQDFCCAICGDSFSNQQINVDHDHSTGEVRGLLCSKCNWGLGNFDDDILKLSKAAHYLFKHFPGPMRDNKGD